MKLLLIRHGHTLANEQGRYLGKTDLPLSPKGMEEVTALAATLPLVDWVYHSPLLRCVQTAEILFPNTPATVDCRMEECDFGAFEGKSFAQLQGDVDYQRWLQSQGQLPFPQGESREAFSARCQAGFWAGVEHALAQGFAQVAFVVHGGSIMAILEAFSPGGEPFYHWQLPPASGFCATVTPHSFAANKLETLTRLPLEK